MKSIVLMGMIGFVYGAVSSRGSGATRDLLLRSKTNVIAYTVNSWVYETLQHLLLICCAEKTNPTRKIFTNIFVVHLAGDPSSLRSLGMTPTLLRQDDTTLPRDDTYITSIKNLFNLVTNSFAFCN